MLRQKLKILIVAISLVFGAGSAKAVPTAALYLLMDGSGSIDSTEFTLQINAYGTALTNVFAAHPELFGQVAIGGGIFGADFFEFFAPIEISDNTVLSNLLTIIANLDPGRGGVDINATAIGDAGTASANSLTSFETSLGVDLKLIIDVTTDGANNTGNDPVAIAGALTPSPIDEINCLGIGAGADCSFVTTAGAGTNFGNVASFADLQAALEKKLLVEFGRAPEPATIALFGLGLAGLGLMRRRRAG